LLQQKIKKIKNNMPNFAPNKGFKMPGVGSKNIDSPGNFRDEQHVDKVGYCDTTEDSMLPEGSSPLKARYTQSGYLKDLDAISIPSSKKSGCPKGYKAVDGKCVKSETKPTPTPKPTPKPTKKKVDFNANQDFGKIEPKYEAIKVEGKTPGKTTTTSYQGKKMSDKAWKALTPEKRRQLNSKAGADKSGKITKTTPGSNTSLTGSSKVETNDKKGDIILGGYSKDSWKRK
jgi:hypothetical protein